MLMQSAVPSASSPLLPLAARRYPTPAAAAQPHVVDRSRIVRRRILGAIIFAVVASGLAPTAAYATTVRYVQPDGSAAAGFYNIEHPPGSLAAPTRIFFENGERVVNYTGWRLTTGIVQAVEPGSIINFTRSVPGYSAHYDPQANAYTSCAPPPEGRAEAAGPGDISHRGGIYTTVPTDAAAEPVTVTVPDMRLPAPTMQLDPAERYVLGRINAKRASFGQEPLLESAALGATADATAALFSSGVCQIDVFAAMSSFGWPGTRGVAKSHFGDVMTAALQLSSSAVVFDNVLFGPTGAVASPPPGKAVGLARVHDPARGWAWLVIRPEACPFAVGDPQYSRCQMTGEMGTLTPPTTSPATPPTSTPSTATDITAPLARLSGSRTQKLRTTLVVNVRCPDEACRASAKGTIRVPKVRATIAKTYKLRSVSRPIARATSAPIKLKLSATTRIAIRRALKARKQVVAKLGVAVVDAAGNKRTMTRRVRLTR